MTVSSQTSTETFNGNGVTTIWDLPFRFFDNTDVLVYLVDPVAQTTTPLALGADYTLTGAGLPEQFGTAPGKITTTLPVVSGKSLLVKRVMELEQLTDIINQGKFFPEVHEDVFDRLTMFIQQNAAGIANSIQLDGSGNFWDFRGHRGINAADPINAQDVATRGWIASFLSSIQGAFNNAANIFFLSADGNARVVQDMSSKTDNSKGTTLLGYKLRTLFQRLSDRGSAADYGVVANGVTLNDTTLATALGDTKGGQLMLEDSNYVVVSAFPPNPRGIRYDGTGAIVMPVTGGLKQLNTYTSKFGIGVHKEAMYKAYARLNVGGTLKTLWCGDSTIQGGNGETALFELDSLVPYIMANKGYSNVAVQNIGVAGTSVSDMNAIPSIDATGANSTDILFIKYGINDPKNLVTYYNNYRGKLQGVRAATNGDVNKLSIVIIGPTSTYDIPNGRDAKWYEQLRGLHVALAEEFQCVYYDPYALMQDTSTAAGFWMDNPFSDGRGIHPLDIGQAWWLGGLMDFLFQPGEMAPFTRNAFQNNPSASGIISFATLATNFNFGLSIYRCTDGPFSGQLVTFRHADGGAWQTLYGFGASPKKVERTWNIAGNAWTGASGSITTATLLNGWVAFGSTRATPGFYRDGNRGYACGTIKSGTTTVATTLFNVPAELRPAADHVCLNRGASGGVGIGINPAGNVFLQSTGDATETCLDNLSWPIA